ncbi:glutamyl-tRNA reductase [Lutibacter sp. TH_r2]|uniref:glutamyl-tRNA reductase n=1 Tax=Lutibacter sp. TH_r2 TaxID=3082083 RepID=UPI00295381EC|nr:glutamyl-tRNA reductase [Lutibacter sp. TH_r2]MDV7187123.1 glutamyl-tRNA reductase [Lutibacter sp. TH_r2]
MSLESLPAKLYNVGLSYKKADVQMRGAFSISKKNQKLLLQEARENGIKGIIVLSTCNRTEITGFAKHPFELISLLVKYSKGNVEDFINISTVYKNKEAIKHLFKIGTGLESQILGDYEIVGQLKEAYSQAKDLNTTNSYLERLMNLVLQASKEVKNNTKLSSGTTSVAYAAVQYLLKHKVDFNSKKVLIYGLGEIGKNTCKNLVEYTTNKNITLINRTKAKALEFQQTHPQIIVKDKVDLINEIENTEILVVSTGSSKATILKEHINKDKNLLILDLSMPENVNPEVKKLKGVTLVNLDELSKITDETIETRKNEIPAVEEIILRYKAEFNDWIEHRKLMPAVNALKTSLESIKNDEIDFQTKKIKDFNVEQAEVITSRIIQKITTQFVKHLKEEDTSVNQSIDVMRKVFNVKEMNLNEQD